ncbi:MAG: CaiB/BaiF CoA transferase family protein [Smithellaceae bacterium]
MAEIFDGLKVLDFTWVVAGPIFTRYLSTHGATVIKVESVSRPNILRTTPPFKDGKAGLNRSQFAANLEVNKRSLGVNMASKEGRDLIRRVIQVWQPDILAENFSTGAMAKWNLDYDSIRGIAPEIIYINSSFYGATGPRAANRGFGNIGSSVVGFDHLTGWPDAAPSGLYGAYIDMVTPPMGIVALIAALDHRRRTGEGQFIDVAQFECGVHHLTPAVLEYELTKKVPKRMANRDLEYCPHGAFPVIGEDRWISIAVTDEKEWESLKFVMGNPSWADDVKFSSASSRKDFEDEIESLISEWTMQQDGHELSMKLDKAGVPSGLVKRCSDLYTDPQLSEMKLIQYLDSDFGSMPYEGSPFRFSETPTHLNRPQANIGQDNQFILEELIGLTDEEIAELTVEGILEFS